MVLIIDIGQDIGFFNYDLWCYCERSGASSQESFMLSRGGLKTAAYLENEAFFDYGP